MIYESTRSNFKCDDCIALKKGISPDGGLFVNSNFDNFDWKETVVKNDREIATDILSYMFPSFDNMNEIVQKAYDGKFENNELSPLRKVGSNFVLELFHGPTCAFKDVALSVLPHLLSRIDDDVTILTATSGDTGKAALEGFCDVKGTKIIVFYPYEGVSNIQLAQMATAKGNNVKVCAVKGNFDDCQTAVKNAFLTLENKKNLSSANSINIGRLAPQLTYYFIAYRELVNNGNIKMGDKVNFCVPTGNFGDILAAYYCKLLGLPVGKLICASNQNNVLTDFLKTGTYDISNRPFYKSTSPSMDILVSSNLERLLYLASNRNYELVKEMMESLKSNGRYKVPDDVMKNITETFIGGYSTENEVSQTIKHIYDDYGCLYDTHTAVAFDVAQKVALDDNVTIILSTASPFKFPEAVLNAIGEKTSDNEFENMDKLARITGTNIPSPLAALENLPHRFKDVIEKEEVCEYVLED